MNVPLPPAHPQADPTNTVLFADLMIIDNDNSHTTQRIVIEITKGLGPQALDYLKQFFLGTRMEKNLPFGLYKRSATRLVPGQALHFALLSETAHCSAVVLSELLLSTQKSPQSPSSTIIQQFSVTVSLSKLKLGHNFDLCIQLSDPILSNATVIMDNDNGNNNNIEVKNNDIVIVGRVIDGMDILKTIMKLKSDPVTMVPLQKIQIVECGEL